MRASLMEQAATQFQGWLLRCLRHPAPSPPFPPRPPARLARQGMELLTGFLRRLVAERARADYDALVDSFASGGAAPQPARSPAASCACLPARSVCLLLCSIASGQASC